ncbi:hypothetical protein BKA70DRAFT_1258059 [Coprinopsis sp. MPI-PUGE-AT-0042]|nr:hypothetical protein BKA70DRAFT_1258059 [Coprinopsis sp. MPI-PUGE-AT-0042]
MGQRHQAFLIARVIPRQGETEAKYRCVAALHHQWCYAHLPLKAAYRFYQRARQPENAALLREDLLQYPKRAGQKQTAAEPCPYASFLLQTAFSVDMDDSGNGQYISFATPLSARMGSSHGDNNDGITLMDITDPQNISLGFVRHPRGSNMTPGSGETYLRAYVGEHDLKKKITKGGMTHADLIAAVSEMPLISLAALAEAWPKEYKIPAPAAEEEVSVADEDTNSLVPSLADLSLNRALQHAMEDDTLELLEHITILPNKVPSILEHLKTAKAFSSRAIPLLSKLFKDLPNFAEDADLSGYNFTGEQILEIVSCGEIKKLNVSKNSMVDKDALSLILPCLSKLELVNIVQTSVTNADLRDLLRDSPHLFHRIRAIVHPFFVDSQEDFQPSIAFRLDLLKNRGMYLHQATYTMPMLSTDGMLDSILDILRMTEVQKNSPMRQALAMDLSAPVFGSLLAAGLPKHLGTSWNEQTMPVLPRPGYKERSGTRYLFLLAFDKSSMSYGVEGGPGQDLWQLRDQFNPSTIKNEYNWRYGMLAFNTGPLGNSEESNETWEILDVPAFLRRIESEGWPSPSDSSKVATINEILSSPSFELLTKETYRQHQVEVAREEQIRSQITPDRCF